MLALGYVGRKMYSPALGALCGDIAVHAMLLASGAAVLVLCLSGFAPAGLSISGWAIGMVLIRRIAFTAD